MFFQCFQYGFTEIIQLSWPTPNPSFAKGLGYSTFLQKTGPNKKHSSGAFGCVRNNGFKFHEGVDLFPIKTSKNGRAEDKVFAAIDGVVSYINQVPAYSSYGKYIVLEHLNCAPSLYTLYAHLEEISPGLRVGSNVEIAQAIGKIGNTSSFRIPLNRSHLHFEVGLRLTNTFQSWYNSKNFQSPNRHSNFSGFNLVGIDPLHFFSQYQNKKFKQPLDYLQALPTIVKARVKRTKKLDFAERYPELCPGYHPDLTIFDCFFGPSGIPLRIIPAKAQVETSSRIQIISYDLHGGQKPCRSLVVKSGDKWLPSEQLTTYIELLFGQ